jgi:hypothetical protein
MTSVSGPGGKSSSRSSSELSSSLPGSVFPAVSRVLNITVPYPPRPQGVASLGRPGSGTCQCLKHIGRTRSHVEREHGCPFYGRPRVLIASGLSRGPQKEPSLGRCTLVRPDLVDRDEDRREATVRAVGGLIETDRNRASETGARSNTIEITRS